MAAPIQFPIRARAAVTKTAAASLVPVRQRTQFTCVAASTSMALAALGLQDCDEDTVNRVLGAAPMKGAAWEQVLATAQHYGVRATLTVPSTLSQVKAWTDAGKPVLIGWNPEGRDWSHASVIFDVQPCPVHGFMVHVADPNCPDPEQVVRVVPKSEFYAKWYEKFPNYLVRRPALMLEREITPEGRQVMASQKNRGTVLVDVPHTVPVSAAARKVQAKAPTPVMPKNKGVVSGPGASQRNVVQQGLIERGTSGAGKHKNKQDFDRGHARSPKHKGQKGWGAEYMTLPVEEACGAEYMQDHAAKFEQGVPADPTKNMSKADAAEWEKQNAMHRDQFKTASFPAQWPKALEDYVLDNPLPLGDSWDIVYMSGDEFKVEAVESVAYLHAKTYYVGEAVVSVIGKTRRGKPFKKQLPVDGKLIRNLIALLNRAKTASGGADLLPSEAARLRAADHAPKTAAGFPRDFDMTENPLQTLKRVPGFQAVSDKALSTKNRAFGIVPTNTLSTHQLSQIRSIAANDTLALVDKHGMALWVGSPANLKINLKSTDRFPWPEVRESAGLVTKTAAGLMTPHGWAPEIDPSDVTRWESVEVESKNGGRTFEIVAYGRTNEAKREVRSVLAFGYKDAERARKEADAYRVKMRIRTAAHRLDGVRGHQLLPATVARKLPAIYSQENVADPVAQVKLFSPYTGAVWYLTEYDPSSKQAFGWADLGMGGGELGYIHIPELEGLNRRGLPLVERDLYWKPMPLSRAKHSRTASQHHAKFPRGEKMTVDEVAAVVGPEFKEMNENPPESVLAIRREMEKAAGTWTPERRLLTALGAVAEAVQHAGLIAREAPHTAQAADKALKLLEAAEQVLGRDVARNLSLPTYR